MHQTGVASSSTGSGCVEGRDHQGGRVSPGRKRPAVGEHPKPSRRLAGDVLPRNEHLQRRGRQLLMLLLLLQLLTGRGGGDHRRWHRGHGHRGHRADGGDALGEALEVVVQC